MNAPAQMHREWMGGAQLLRMFVEVQNSSELLFQRPIMYCGARKNYRLHRYVTTRVKTESHTVHFYNDEVRKLRFYYIANQYAYDAVLFAIIVNGYYLNENLSTVGKNSRITVMWTQILMCTL